ncbi:MAG: FtsW/RodA/SpoVE family cell cycle protein [Lachnospiraceae bacterium]|nr:FtsW/RodA/SpoVE family cell cycle protein [Lachnospiraceae bacterium]
MEEYMKTLLEQIRCKKVHPYIREELQGHIEEQTAENMSQGMTKEEAEAAAVKDMGSPVEVGISLDSIHRPQTAWGMIGLMAVISIAGILLHLILNSRLGEQAVGSDNFILYTIIGFGLMLVVYHVDYSVIARFSVIIAVLLLGICACSYRGGITIHGNTAYGYMFSVMTLYVPVYGALLYRYHGQGYSALVKAVFWMLLPVFMAYRLPCLSLALMLMMVLSIVLTIALWNGWFQVAEKRVICALWGGLLSLPAIGLIIGVKYEWLEQYQIARIRSFLDNSDTYGVNYVTVRLRENLTACKWIGNGGYELSEYVQGFNSDYILSYIFSDYGFLAGAIICGVLTILGIKIFAIAFWQKNQLGMCMSCGCGVILLMNVLLNIGENIGILPISQTFLPFFSAGGGNVITCYILMGIILSVYRYKNIYPRHVKVKRMEAKVTISL